MCQPSMIRYRNKEGFPTILNFLPKWREQEKDVGLDPESAALKQIVRNYFKTNKNVIPSLSWDAVTHFGYSRPFRHCYGVSRVPIQA